MRRMGWTWDEYMQFPALYVDTLIKQLQQEDRSTQSRAASQAASSRSRGRLR